jgi:hypothetical protein
VNTLTPQQRREITARAICDDRTVKHAYAGMSVKPASRERIRRAAIDLGLPLPPTAKAEAK